MKLGAFSGPCPPLDACNTAKSCWYLTHFGRWTNWKNLPREQRQAKDSTWLPGEVVAYCLPLSVKPLGKHPHRYTQKCVSQMTQHQPRSTTTKAQ